MKYAFQDDSLGWIAVVHGWAPATLVALANRRVSARADSLSALQKFSACPYQFVLSAIYRLQPIEAPQQFQSGISVSLMSSVLHIELTETR